MKSTYVQKMKKVLSTLMVAIMIALSVTSVTGIVAPTVVEAAAQPTISKKTRNILVGKKYNLNIKNKVKKSTYVWTTSDKKVATVNKRGIVTAKKQGTATITCTITTPKKEVVVVTCKVTVRGGADKFTIKNKVSALNLGQEYDLNRTLAPKASNDKTTWTTSDATIAKPDSLGKFTALKEGTVTITGTTLSGATDSVTFTVVDEEGIVTNQEELDALVGSGASLVTIKTDAEVNLKIKSGKYNKQTLVVDAPNAEIENNGLFKAVEIREIKANTWFERAKGNTITVLDKDVRIIVGNGASVSIVVKGDKVSLTIVNNGLVEELIVAKDAKIEITGDSKTAIPVSVDATGVEIKSSISLDITATEKIALTLLKGAEDTKITVDDKDSVPSITGNVTIKVVVGDGESATEVSVVGTPIADTPSTGGSTGGGGGGSITPTPDEPGTYKLTGSLASLTAIEVNYAGIKYEVPSSILNELKRFLNNDTTTIATWMNTTNTTKEYDGVTVTVTGDEGSTTKTVTFSDNVLLNGRSYAVTVNSSDNSVTLNGANLTFIVKKVNDTTIKITPAPSGLSFVGTYN